MKKTLSLILIAGSSAAFACTGMYVGKKVSVEGHTLIGRTIDSISPTIAKCVQIVERVENSPGRIYVGGDEHLGLPLPATTYKSIVTPVSNTTRSYRYDSACINEMGVIYSGTVTGATAPAALRADPFVPSGAAESNISGYIIQTSATAREAVERLLKVIDEKGHNGPEIYMMADTNEAWYVEVYTGHQYAAIKMPEDKVLVIGNQFMLGEFDPNEKDVYYSKDLLKLPVKAKFAKYGPNGKINLAATYGKPRTDYSNIRTWFGHKFLAPQDKIGDYARTNEYPLFFTPKNKVSKLDLFKLMRSRYEGTKYDDSLPGNEDVRVIGTVKQCSSHVLEVTPNLPREKQATMYVTLSNAEHSPFLPINASVAKIADGYDILISNMDTKSYYESLPAHRYRRLAVTAELDRHFLGNGVRSYWEKLEERLCLEYPAIVEGSSSEFITDYTKTVFEESLADAKRMFDEISWYNVKYSRTKGDMAGKPLPEKIPYRYSRHDASPRCRPRFAAIIGAAQTNKMTLASHSLVNSLAISGYVPIVIPYSVDDKFLKLTMNHVDAIIIGGQNGGDNFSWRREFDAKAIHIAAKRKIPVLGFCHGHQVINLAFGGTIGPIDQQKEGRLKHKVRIRPSSRNCFHPVNIATNTFLHSVVGGTELRVNSSHVYEIKNVGKGLIASAVSPDGVVEALEHETLPITSYQFHPETILDMGDVYNQLIIKALNRKPKK